MKRLRPLLIILLAALLCSNAVMSAMALPAMLAGSAAADSQASAPCHASDDATRTIDNRQADPGDMACCQQNNCPDCMVLPAFPAMTPPALVHIAPALPSAQPSTATPRFISEARFRPPIHG
ncbi:MAG TPA: hypothetical protein VIN71_01060 [Pseudomonadales bacterium]